jgi:predicted MPP superfamily phosphohydrolase
VGVLTSAAAVSAWAFLVEPDWIEVTRHRVKAPLRAPLTIAHLSDLHVASFGRREESLLRSLAAARPDLIVITGDSVSGTGAPEELRRDDAPYAPVRDLLMRLRAPLGVFAVRGNWENWRPLTRERAFYEAAGVKLLVNEAARVRDDVWLLGLDEASNGAPDVAEAREGVPAHAYRIVLFHAPVAFDGVAGREELALAGHTHGGQVRVPLLPPLWLPPGSDGYVAGWYEKRGSRLYVSRGIGTSIAPARLFCRPELAVHTLGP